MSVDKDIKIRDLQAQLDGVLALNKHLRDKLNATEALNDHAGNIIKDLEEEVQMVHTAMIAVVVAQGGEIRVSVDKVKSLRDGHGQAAIEDTFNKDTGEHIFRVIYKDH